MEINDIGLKATSNFGEVAKDADKLAQSLKNLNSASKQTNSASGGANATNNTARNVKKQVQDATSIMEKYKKQYADVGKGWNFLGDENQIKDKMRQFTNNFADAQSKLELAMSKGNEKAIQSSVLSVMSYQNKLASLNSKVADFDAEKTSVGMFDRLKGIMPDIGSALSSFASGVNKALTPVKLLGKGMAQLGWNILKVASPIKYLIGALKTLTPNASNLSKSIERLGKMFRLMIVRSALQAFITNGKNGFKNLAQYSDEFNASLSLMWNSIRQAGNALAAASSPLINTFAPAIDFAINKIIDLINWINQLVSSVLGRSTWIKASKLTDSYADSLNKAGGAAKALNKQLQGFNELNNLTSGNGGGGGGGSATTNPNDMFTTENVDSFFTNIADKLKETWNTTVDFSWLGADIGEKLSQVLSNYETDILPRFRTNAEKLGKAIGTTITGFVQVDGLGEQIGRTIGEAIGVGIGGLDSFVSNTNWSSVGTFIGNALNGFVLSGLASDFSHLFVDSINGGIHLLSGLGNSIQFRAIGEELAKNVNLIAEGLDTGELASMLSTWVGGAIEGISELLQDTDFKLLGEKIAEFINNIKWKDLALDLAELAASILIALTDAIKGLWTDSNATTKIGLAIAGLIALAKFGVISLNIPASAFSLAGTGIGSAILGLIKNAMLADLGAVFTSGSLAAIGSTIFIGVTSALATAFAGWSLGKWLYENTDLGDWIDSGIEGAAKTLGFEVKDTSDYASYKTVGENKYGSAYAKTYADQVQKYINSGMSSNDALKQAVKDMDALLQQNANQIKEGISSGNGIFNTFKEINTTDIPEVEVKAKVTDINYTAETERQKAFSSQSNVTTINYTAETEKQKHFQATAETNKINDNLTVSQKTLGNFTSVLNDKIDNINGKTLNNFVANIMDRTDSIKNKVLGSFVASITDKQDGIPNKVLNYFIARITDKQDGITNKSLGGFTAGLISKTDNIQDKNIWNMIARLQSKTDNIKDKGLDGFSARLWTTVDGISNKGLDGFSAIARTFDGTNIPQSERVIKNCKAEINKLSVGGAITALVGNQKADGGVFTNGQWKPIQQFASGGIPGGGQMFIAREAGPELVGTIGGHTAVMNNDQIVSSVASAVASASYNAMMAAMSNGSQNVTVVLEGDAKGVFKVVQKQAREYTRTTGNTAFA